MQTKQRKGPLLREIIRIRDYHSLGKVIDYLKKQSRKGLSMSVQIDGEPIELKQADCEEIKEGLLEALRTIAKFKVYGDTAHHLQHTIAIAKQAIAIARRGSR